jgi:hypothetical protein
MLAGVDGWRGCLRGGDRHAGTRRWLPRSLKANLAALLYQESVADGGPLQQGRCLVLAAESGHCRGRCRWEAGVVDGIVRTGRDQRVDGRRQMPPECRRRLDKALNRPTPPTEVGVSRETAACQLDCGLQEWPGGWQVQRASASPRHCCNSPHPPTRTHTPVGTNTQTHKQRPTRVDPPAKDASRAGDHGARVPPTCHAAQEAPPLPSHR